MEGKNTETISIKAAVDEKNNKVIFVESDDEFVDVLLSFLTMPLGTIIRLAGEHSMPLKMGCMTNLYDSVKNIDLHHFHFHSEDAKLMFLSPRSEAESHCVNLKLTFDDRERTVFSCLCYDELYSHYKDVFCKCQSPMNREYSLGKGVFRMHEGVFVNGMAKFLITNGLQVVPMSSLESFSLLAKHGITDARNVRERIFSVGADEALNLLIYSLQSRTPLTEVLLKNKRPLDLSLCGEVFTETQKDADHLPDQNGRISVKLMVSKSKKMVCYAEANKDFVNFLLSFLTIPLGHTAKLLHDFASCKGCIDQLHKSVQDLDVQLFKSNLHKEMLVSPSLAFGFSYKNDLLGIKSASAPAHRLRPHINFICLETACGKIDEGILTGLSTMFIVTDSLTVTPMSSLFCMSVLKDLKIPFSDIEEQVVQVGKYEAVRLLLSSFFSESALTNAFIRDPNRKSEPH